MKPFHAEIGSSYQQPKWSTVCNQPNPVSNYNPTAYTTTPDSQNMLVDDDNPTTIILDTEGTYRGIYSHGFFQETSARSTSVENRSTALGMHID